MVSFAAYTPIAADFLKERAERISSLPTTGEAWSKQTAEDIRYLWSDSALQSTYNERDKAYQLNDSAS